MNYDGKGVIYDTLTKQYYRGGKFNTTLDDAEKVPIGKAIHIVESRYRHESYSLKDSKERRYVIISIEKER